MEAHRSKRRRPQHRSPPDAEDSGPAKALHTLEAKLSGRDSGLNRAELFGIGELAGRILEDLGVWLNIHDENLNMIFWNRVAQTAAISACAEAGPGAIRTRTIAWASSRKRARSCSAARR